MSSMVQRPNGTGPEFRPVSGTLARNRNEISILVVDDEPYILEILEMLLEEEGYRVHTASNARDALNLVMTGDVHLIVTDMMMPGMSGYDLYQAVQDVRGKQPPEVILMSAVRLGDYDHAVTFLQKPFDFDDFLAMIDRRVSRGVEVSA